MTLEYDSPEGVALALAYLIVQQKRPNEPVPDLITLYRKCVAVVTGPCGPEWREALLDKVLH
jgi:hypothetical protein